MGAPHGVNGWLRLLPSSPEAQWLEIGMRIWCCPPRGEWQYLQLINHRSHSYAHWVHLETIEDRTAAEQWVHGEIAIPLEELPPLAEEHFYWRDLIGLRTVTADAEELGVVVDLIQTGANEVLCVRNPSSQQEYLIPFVRVYVLSVSLSEQQITVDWKKEW